MMGLKTRRRKNSAGNHWQETGEGAGKSEEKGGKGWAANRRSGPGRPRGEAAVSRRMQRASEERQFLQHGAGGAGTGTMQSLSPEPRPHMTASHYRRQSPRMFTVGSLQPLEGLSWMTPPAEG